MTRHRASPTSRKARISDVARAAGVSTATVSRALRQPALVHPSTLASIRRVVEQVGYVADGAARALASGRTHTVAAIVPTLDNAIFARMVQALQTTLAEAGFQLLIASHEYNAAAEAELAHALLERAIEALVLVGTDHSGALAAAVEASGVRCVVTWSLDARWPSVGFDNAAIGSTVARYLLSLGHREFGVISGHFRHNDRARARVAGFRGALAEAGIELPASRVVEQSFGFEGGRTGLDALFSLRPRPTALFCGNDTLAAGALLEAQAQGIAVPQQLSIVGCDDLPIAAQLVPGLTTVLLPTWELGRQAAQLLLEWIDRGQAPQSRALPFELAVRGSSGPALGGAAHPGTAQAPEATRPS